VSLDGAHTAGADALAALACARSMLEADYLKGLHPDDLHAVQAKWYGWWLDDFREYRRARGQEPIEELTWPGVTW
jgi:hypothetical protein